MFFGRFGLAMTRAEVTIVVGGQRAVTGKQVVE